MIPTRWELRRVARLAGDPTIRLGRMILGGPEGWDRVCDRATPPDRECLAARLAWPAARASNPQRFAAWLAAPRSRETAAQRLTRIRECLLFFGDVEAFAPVVTALAQMPRPVADHALVTCMFLATGRSSGGWTGSLLPPDRRPILIAAHQCDAGIRRIVAHECGHVWVALDRPGQLLRTVREHAMVLGSSKYGPQERAAIEAEEATVRLLTVAWMCGVTAYRAPGRPRIGGNGETR